jgi:hypothetical protein
LARFVDFKPLRNDFRDLFADTIGKLGPKKSLSSTSGPLMHCVGPEAIVKINFNK